MKIININDAVFDTHFECPKCGSYMFGSSSNGDNTLTRNCHGNEKWQCDFEFHEKEDSKYFKHGETKTER